MRGNGRGRLIAGIVVASMLAAAWVTFAPILSIFWSFATGTGSTPLDLVLPADPRYRLEARIDGTVLRTDVFTTLPDGSRLDIWATYAGEAPGGDILTLGPGIVQAGRYHHETDLRGWPDGPVIVTAVFDPSIDQPAEVRVRFGADGSRMSGPRVRFDEDTDTWALQDWLTVRYVAPGPRPVPTPTPTMAPDAGSFVQTSSMVASRVGHAAARLSDGRVLLVGGDVEYGEEQIRQRPTAEIFDPASDTFTATAPMVTGRERSTATLLRDGRVLVVGGYGGNGHPLASAEIFDPGSGTFEEVEMVTARSEHSATLLPDGRVLIAGGVGSEATATIFDPAAGRFVPTGSMTTPRSGHTATSLPDGRVLIVGGSGGVDTLASSEIYDPITGRFTPSASMLTTRETHAAVALGEGRVLVSGGLGPPDQYQLASAEIYDPDTDTFSPAGALVSARNFHTMTLLDDGRVLVAGGFDAGESIRGCELFDPVSASFAPAAELRFTTYGHTTTLLADGRVLVAGGHGDAGGEPGAQIYMP
jgi:hypothetical protein